MPAVLKEVGGDWDAIGALDPFWGMTGERDSPPDLEQFLDSGDREIERVLMIAAAYRLPQQHSAALDFGCGVGRLTRGLRSHFDTYHGLDISQQMVQHAGTIHATRAGCSFSVSNDPALGQFQDAVFDLVYTNLVLQHIPDRQIVRSYLHNFLRILRPGGLIVFQLPHHVRLWYRIQPRRRLYSTLRRIGISHETLFSRLRLHPNQIHHIPAATIEHWISQSGGQIVQRQVITSEHAPHQSSVYYVTHASTAVV
ncbi:MAG TPA: class I SAM-dependent methyltransferase [Roseiflexaceae bacterium]|nr:class I SAM-dependent methyltransferase [Roseiflexaceae bacterium]HMP43219.1 class I SAM-dependent methyltransferase [Roseiflexaceae bacterium]